MKTVDFTKKLFFIVSSQYDYRFAISDDNWIYCKNQQEGVLAAKFLAKNPGGQVVCIETDESRDYDDSEEIVEEVYKIMRGNKTLDDFGFSIIEVCDDIDEL